MLTLVREVQEYKPEGYLSVGVNENNITMLNDGIEYLFETNMKNFLSKALRGDGSDAPSPGGITLDVRLVPLVSTATHDPVEISKSLWKR